ALARWHKTRQRQVQHGQRIVADLDAMRHGELHKTTDNEWLAAKHAVGDTFTVVAPLDPQQVFGQEFTVEALLEHLRPAASRVLRSAALEPAAVAGYQRMLERCCLEIVQALLDDGDFMGWVTSEIYNSVRRTEDIVRGVRADLSERSRTAELRAFERRYLDDVAESISGFELFQVNVGRAPQKYPFDRFYAIPSVTRRISGAEDDADSGLTGAGTDGANAINDARHVLLLGGAGAGKTTFLQWLAYTAARDDRRLADSPWRDVVPFYIPLRRFADTALPQMEDLLSTTAWTLTGEKPDQWVSRLFRSGRALLLVDGVDELPTRRRREVKSWLEDMVRGFPDARYVISTRPSAVDETWLAGSRSGSRAAFVRLELLPLSGSGLREVIGCWYTAAREDESDPVQREWLTACERGLIESLDTRPELRILVSSPLLCALLCALYRQGNMYLPHSRRELLEAALDLLLVRWDIHRGLSVDVGLQMSKAEQLVLLQRFAASMAREEELLVSKQVAQRRLQAAMRGLRSHDADPADVLQHVLERTGLLREHPLDHQVRFVHRTFRDYLVAKEMVKSGELSGLVNHADEDSWHEVVFMG
ncbi:MAG: NACHT domain-containing protein, partial [Pseudonocardiaceae bacterium]